LKKTTGEDNKKTEMYKPAFAPCDASWNHFTDHESGLWPQIALYELVSLHRLWSLSVKFLIALGL
jgi:mannose/cellobiose epimerase-like protein (N-acyl-D-glucosamine 2-epimerase family)